MSFHSNEECKWQRNWQMLKRPIKILGALHTSHSDTFPTIFVGLARHIQECAIHDAYSIHEWTNKNLLEMFIT